MQSLTWLIAKATSILHFPANVLVTWFLEDWSYSLILTYKTNACHLKFVGTDHHLLGHNNTPYLQPSTTSESIVWRLSLQLAHQTQSLNYNSMTLNDVRNNMQPLGFLIANFKGNNTSYFDQCSWHHVLWKMEATYWLLIKKTACQLINWNSHHLWGHNDSTLYILTYNTVAALDPLLEYYSTTIRTSVNVGRSPARFKWNVDSTITKWSVQPPNYDNSGSSNDAIIRNSKHATPVGIYN